MATAEEVNNMLTLAAEATSASNLQPFSFTAIETDSMASVDIEELKPIIMTMANMGAVTEAETHVEVATIGSQADAVYQAEHVLSDHLTGNDREIREVFVDDSSGVTYEVVRGGTKRGGDRLIDSLGFTYNLKQNKSSKNVSYWWCSVRNSHLRCPAAVIQKNGRFFRGKRKHEHNIGTSTPKDANSYSRVPRKPFGRHSVALTDSEMKRMGNTRDYRVIPGGSKAGMDLLRDSNGYTYTLKKSTADGWKKSWRCSVRNRLLQCAAIVVQYGQQFVPGNVDHGHLPGLNRPLGPNDIVPPQPRGRGVNTGEDFEDDDDDLDDDEEEGGKSVFKNQTRYISQRNRAIMRHKKRRSHPTFLGPSCTINLTKCEDLECNCKLVHCPFCDKLHFKPAKAGRVQDHLEMTHFAHGVQFDDLMIVKCFQDCSLERSYGHYHCVFCFQQILKRNAYARHMLRHMRQMSIPDRLLVLPDSKFPDVINAYGYEIPICKKTGCQPFSEKHYHCPSCEQICAERSLTVNHLWRCLQRKETAASGVGVDTCEDPEEEMLHTIDESQLILHQSHVKTFKDLPLTKCVDRGCCEQKYHCQLCPDYIFHPTYKQHLIAHYITHWKQRVSYKGISILKCFQFCDGIDRSMLKTRYHFHCPICAKIICTKGSFQDHLISCHMLKFGENLLNQDLEQMDNTLEEDLFMSQETAPLLESIDRMEEKVTSQAVANEIGSQLDKINSRRSYSSHSKSPRTIKSSVAEIRENLTRSLGLVELGGEGGEEAEGSGATPGRRKKELDLSQIRSTEIFELASAVISEKFVKALQSRDVLTSVLSKVSEMTNTKVGEVPKNNKYLLSGRIEDLLSAKQMIVELISKMKKDDKPVKTGRGRGRPRKHTIEDEEEEEEEEVEEEEEEEEEEIEDDEEGDTSRSSGTRGRKPVAKKTTPPATVKKGRGRPRKSEGGEKFPYSEIKEIIAANKKSEAENRGRGRPAGSKKTPAKSIKTSRMAESLRKEQEATPSTPGRYSTRGIKRNYVEMNAGIYKEIKKEPLSDYEDNNVDEDIDGDDYMKSPRGKKRKEEGTVEKSVKRGRGRPRKVQVEEGEDGEGEDGGEDDVAKMDGTSGGAVKNGETVGTSVVSGSLSNESDMDDIEELDMTADRETLNETGDQEKEEEESGSKITDSAIKRLKTSNVSTSVPQVFKVGIRSRNVGKKKGGDGAGNADDEIDLEMEKVRKTLHLTCSLCEDHTEESFSSLTQHLRTVHGVIDPPRCDLCELDFDTLLSLNLHLDRRHGPRTQPASFVCQYDECGKVFSSQNGLTCHINRVHIGLEAASQGMKKYACGTCTFKTNSMEDLCEHKKVEHGQKIECDICHKQFSSFFSLKSHKEVKHSVSGYVTCNICYKRFSHIKYLRRHTQVHYTEQFMCHVCSKTLSNKASLRAHLETHKPEWERKYKYECEFCNKKFTLKSNFNDHLNKHTGEKPYKCDNCSKAFGFRSMLMRHKLFVHTNERPFKCGVCMKGFKFMNLLQNHMTTHSNRSKHRCDLCTKYFTTGSTLKFHQRKCTGSKNPYSHLRPPVAPVAPPGSTYVLITDPTSSVDGGVASQHLVAVSDPSAVSNLAVPTSDIQYTVMLDNTHEKDDSLGMTALIPDQSSLLADDGTSMVIEETVDTPVTAPVADQQLFACSECSATFASYAEAETHVLTAHQAQVALPPDTMEVMVEETEDVT